GASDFRSPPLGTRAKQISSRPREMPAILRGRTLPRLPGSTQSCEIRLRSWCDLQASTAQTLNKPAPNKFHPRPAAFPPADSPPDTPPAGHPETPESRTPTRRRIVDTRRPPAEYEHAAA